MMFKGYVTMQTLRIWALFVAEPPVRTIPASSLDMIPWHGLTQSWHPRLVVGYERMRQYLFFNANQFVLQIIFREDNLDCRPWPVQTQ
jgi:hypothetical protein